MSVTLWSPSVTKRISGLISIADSIRPAAPEVVRTLNRLGIAQVVRLSGDNQGTAQAVAAVTGVDQCWAELLPGDVMRMLDDNVALKDIRAHVDRTYSRFGPSTSTPQVS